MKSLPSVGDMVKTKKGFKQEASGAYDVEAGKTYKVVEVDDVNNAILLEVEHDFVQWVHISEVKKVSSMKKFTLIDNGDGGTGYVVNDSMYVNLNDLAMYAISNAKKMKDPAEFVVAYIESLLDKGNVEVFYYGKLVVAVSQEGKSKVGVHYREDSSEVVNYRDIIGNTIIEELLSYNMFED